jgi:hypothetical protein
MLDALLLGGDLTPFAFRLLDQGDLAGSAVEPIVADDSSLYASLCRRTAGAACYADAFSYILQACRGLRLKCRGEGMLASLGMHRGHFVVVRPFGMLDGRFVHLLDRLACLSGRPVFVKKIQPEQRGSLKNVQGLRVASVYDATRRLGLPGAYTWDNMAYADDDTYPEQVLDLDVTLGHARRPSDWARDFQKASGMSWRSPAFGSLKRGYKALRKRLQRFLNCGRRLHLRNLEPDRLPAVRRFLQAYFGPDRPECPAAYDDLLAYYVAGDKKDGLFSYIAHLDDDPTPVGFFAAERLDELSAGLYAGVCLRADAGVPEAVRVQVMSRLRETGVRFLNLGGSEVRGLHRYKQHFAPVEERVLPMLVYGA